MISKKFGNISVDSGLNVQTEANTRNAACR